MGDHLTLATIDIGRKVGGELLRPFPWAELGPHLTQCGLGEAYFRTKRHPNPSNCLATTHQRHRQADMTDSGPIA